MESLQTKYFVTLFICMIVGITSLSYLEMNYQKQVNKFTMAVFQTIATKDDNVVSPYSIHLALTMLGLGTQGQTAKDLQAKLYPDGFDSLKKATLTVLNKSNKLRGVTLNIANKIYIKNGVTLNKKYKQDVKQYLLSEVSNLDFSNTVGAASTINDWISTNTKGKITNLILPSDLSPSTIIALINAIYFKGNWEKPFNPINTITGDFFNDPNTQVPVQLMQQKNKFPFASLPDLDAQVLEMFYDGKAVSMIWILPNKLDGLKQVEAKLTSNYDVKKNVFDKLKLQEVTVTVPKFKIEKQLDLKVVLPQMGITSIFDPDANFSGITFDKIPLQISKAIHKAIIEVDEKGTVAAATTVITLDESVQTYFIANHPFIVIIKNNESGLIYFIGKKENF